MSIQVAMDDFSAADFVVDPVTYTIEINPAVKLVILYADDAMVLALFA